MVHHTLVKRQLPVGLFAVFILLLGCVLYTANFPDDPSHAGAPVAAEPILFNGIYQDDPRQIRQAVAVYGTLPEDLADIAMNMAATQGHPHAVAELLKCGVPLDSRTLSGRTALISAAEIPNNVAMVKQLLDAGADPTAITCDGHTAIDYGRAIGDQPAVDLLTAALARHH